MNEFDREGQRVRPWQEVSHVCKRVRRKAAKGSDTEVVYVCVTDKLTY